MWIDAIIQYAKRLCQVLQLSQHQQAAPLIELTVWAIVLTTVTTSGIAILTWVGLRSTVLSRAAVVSWCLGARAPLPCETAQYHPASLIGKTAAMSCHILRLKF